MLRFTVLALTATLAILACSSSSSTTPQTDGFAGSCNLLASRCHPIKTALGQECHDLGHDGDDAKCGPRKSECLAECPETPDVDAAAPGDGNGPAAEDAGSDAGADADAAPSPCQTYCTCMAAACASEPGYPFADEAACLAACAGFSEKDRSCFTDHCEDAKVAADKKHDCEHASGTIACH